MDEVEMETPPSDLPAVLTEEGMALERERCANGGVLPERPDGEARDAEKEGPKKANGKKRKGKARKGKKTDADNGKGGKTGGQTTVAGAPWLTRCTKVSAQGSPLNTRCTHRTPWIIVLPGVIIKRWNQLWS